MNISKFENKIGMKIEDLNEEKFIQILKSVKLFSDEKDAMDTLDEIIKRRQDNPEFVRELTSVKFSLQLDEDAKILDKLFERYRNGKITREELINQMKIFRSSSDPIFVISTVICSMIALEDVQLKDEENIIKSSINGVKNIFECLGRIETTYPLRCDLIDLLYTLRSKYFNHCGIILDMDWVDEETDKLIEFQSQLNKREIPEIGIKPEQLGFLDITKLKGGEDGKN